MKIINLFILCFFIAGVNESDAQTNFLKGYYVSLQKDTVHGYIEYRSKNRNFTFIAFKSEIESVPQKIYPDDILGYVIGDKVFYETHEFKSKRGNEVLLGFFQVVIRGKLSLLSYESRFFAKDDKGVIYEITKRKEVVDGNLKSHYYGLGILKVLMADCSDITPAFIEKTYLSEQDFESLFEQYNRCVNSPFYKSEEIKVHGHQDFGIQISMIGSGFYLDSYQGKKKFANDISFNGGGFISIFLPRIDERLRIVIEASYGKYVNYKFFEHLDTNNDMFVNYTYFKVPSFMRYSRERLFFDIGFQNQFITSQNIQWRVETLQSINTQQNLDNVITNDREVDPLSGRSFGLLAGIGLRYKVNGYAIRPSLRFSLNNARNYSFQCIDFVFSAQLTK